LAVVLATVAQGEPLLADQPAADVPYGRQRIDLANGWMMAVWWGADEIGPLAEAFSPEGEHWIYGCDRWPDWNAGPDAVPLDPLTHLVSAEQRLAIAARLRDCCCWPQPEDQVGSFVPASL
jgi:hypothetical protein